MVLARSRPNSAIRRSDTLCASEELERLREAVEEIMQRQRQEVDSVLKEWIHQHGPRLQVVRLSPKSHGSSRPFSPKSQGSSRPLSGCAPPVMTQPTTPPNPAAVMMNGKDAHADQHWSAGELDDKGIETKAKPRPASAKKVQNKMQTIQKLAEPTQPGAVSLTDEETYELASDCAQGPGSERQLCEAKLTKPKPPVRFNSGYEEKAKAWEQSGEGARAVKAMIRKSQRSSVERAIDSAEDAEQDEESHVEKTRNRLVFADAEAMKQKLKDSLHKEEYNVASLYHKTGIFRQIATHSIFENITLFVIGVNAIWMSYDTDGNTASVLSDAEIQFIIVENMFCFFFFFEWAVRFMAFRRKTFCIRDGWFIFDSCLLLMMMTETWILPLIMILPSQSGTSIISKTGMFRWFRLVRLTRLARMARILRAMPELLIMVKAIIISMKTVVYALALLFLMIYVFAIAFTQMMDGSNQEPGTAAYDYFRSVPISMNTLLLQGAVPDQAGLVDVLGAESFVYYGLFLVYLLIASLTLMNMLIGILCEVIGVVSAVEKEQMMLHNVKACLQAMMRDLGLASHCGSVISKSDFARLLVEPRAARTLQDVGVDVIGLVDFTDYIFPNDREELSFSDFMEVILELRGSNTATVKDIVDLRKLIMNELVEGRHPDIAP